MNMEETNSSIITRPLALNQSALQRHYLNKRPLDSPARGVKAPVLKSHPGCLPVPLTAKQTSEMGMRLLLNANAGVTASRLDTFYVFSVND